MLPVDIIVVVFLCQTSLLFFFFGRIGKSAVVVTGDAESTAHTVLAKTRIVAHQVKYGCRPPTSLNRNDVRPFN